MEIKNIKFILWSYILIFLMLVSTQNAGSQVAPLEKVFKAGAATANITPFLGSGLVGNSSPPPLATNVHDELHARCLVIDDGDTKLVFIVVDNVGMNRDLIEEAKRLILKETGIPAENVLMSVTHTPGA